MNLPNALTLLRLVLCPFFLLVYVYPSFFSLSDFQMSIVLVVLFVFMELSDLFDGYFARKYGQVTDLGKLLDPMADSIARTSAFLAFTQSPVSIPVWMVFILLYRDSVVSTLRTLFALKGVALAARKSGKIKAAIQAIAVGGILVLLIPYTAGVLSLTSLQFYSALLAGFATLYTIVSGLEYLVFAKL